MGVRKKIMEMKKKNHKKERINAQSDV